MTSPVAGAQRPHRKPLQPRNSWPKPALTGHSKPKAAQLSDAAGKENRPAVEPVGLSLEATLAEELGAVRRWRERLRAEREQTEQLLNERDAALERRIRDMERRAEEQRKLELEVLTVIRLKDLLSCARSSPLQSLREREQEKKRREAQLQVNSCSQRVGPESSTTIEGNETDD